MLYPPKKQKLDWRLGTVEDEMEDDEEKDPSYLPQDMELEEYVDIHMITAVCKLLANICKLTSSPLSEDVMLFACVL